MRMYLFIASVLLLVLAACSDDNSTDNPEKNYEDYMPMIIGVNNLADVYAIDENENRIEKIRSGDTIGFTHEMMIGDKNCKIITGRDAQGNVTFMSGYYCEGSKLWVTPWMYKQFVEFFIDTYGNHPFLPADDELWLLADFSKDTWQGFEERTVTDFEIREGAKFNSLTISQIGYKTKEFKMDIDGKSYDAIEFVTEFIEKGSSTIDGETTEINGRHILKYVYAKGVGLVHYKSLPFTAEHGFGLLPFPGDETIAVKINVK